MNRIVVKVGSSSIVNEKSQSIYEERINSIVEDIRWLIRDQNKEVILMSSGALAWGRVCMAQAGYAGGYQEQKWLSCACGQVGISAAWAASARKHGLILGQFLLTSESMRSTTLCSTIDEMLKHDVLPYINENIPTMEEYDNDGLVAEVSRHLGCDTLILLSDVDGVYSKNPKVDPNADLIKDIHDIDEAIALFGGTTSTTLGTGGMITKLNAAKRAAAIEEVYAQHRI